MAIRAREGEIYTVRRQVFKILGAAFHIYDAENNLAGYCKQKAFKLKEDIRIYTDESMSQELLVLSARSIIDFGVTFDVCLPSGELLGSFRRKGLKSSFVRDEWIVFDDENNQVALLREKGSFLSFARRYNDWFALLSPQQFEFIRSTDQSVIATLRQHFNLFVYRLGVTVHEDDPHLDELMILGATCLIAAIEGRQG